MKNLRSLLRVTFFPVMFIGFNGLSIWIANEALGFGSTLLLMFIALITSFMVEIIIPYNADWNESQGDTKRDIFHFFTNETMNYAGIFLLPFLSVFTLYPEVWPKEWPFLLQLIFAIVIFDLATTLFHYFSHKKPILWKFHAVHHAPARLYGLNGIMKHPLFQVMDSLVAVGPLLVIGIPQEVAHCLVFAIFIQLLIQHSNADMSTGPLRFLFATAELHRFHHLKGKAGDVNFALFLSVWDRILGTAYYEDRVLTEGDLGIGSEPNYPKGYLQQLKKPFGKKITMDNEMGDLNAA